MTRLLQVEDLIVGHGKPVLAPLSFTLDEGEVLGLWGPNGVGKTTLLGAFTGSAQVFGGRIWRRPGLRVAYQAQHAVRLKELPLTGRELLGVMDVAVEQAPKPLADWLHQRLDCLSGGQLQLLRTWACLASPVELLLLDEPTNNLDPHSLQVLKTMLTALPTHCGVLLVSHERDFIDQVCTHVLEINS